MDDEELPMNEIEAIIADHNKAMRIDMASEITGGSRSKAITDVITVKAIAQLIKARDEQQNITAMLLGKWNAYEELLLNESIKEKRRKEVELRASQLRASYEERATVNPNQQQREAGWLSGYEAGQSVASGNLKGITWEEAKKRLTEHNQQTGEK